MLLLCIFIIMMSENQNLLMTIDNLNHCNILNVLSTHDLHYSSGKVNQQHINVFANFNQVVNEKISCKDTKPINLLDQKGSFNWVGLENIQINYIVYK